MFAEGFGMFRRLQLARLKRDLQHRNVSVRARAVRLLGQMRGTEAVSLLLAVLEDDDLIIRRGAAYALGRRAARGEEVVVGLSRLLTEKDPDLRAVAAWGLGQSGEPSAAGALMAALADADSLVRMNARIGLARIRAAAHQTDPDIQAQQKTDDGAPGLVVTGQGDRSDFDENGTVLEGGTRLPRVRTQPTTVAGARPLSAGRLPRVRTTPPRSSVQ